MNFEDFVEIDSSDVKPGRIPELRARLRRTQSEMAQLLGTTHSSLGRWESGETNCSGSSAKLFRTLERLVDHSELWSLTGYEVTRQPLGMGVLEHLRGNSRVDGNVYGYVLQADDGKMVTLRAQADERGAAALGNRVEFEHDGRRTWSVAARIAASLEKRRVLYSEWATSLRAVAEQVRQRLISKTPKDRDKSMAVSMLFFDKDVQYFYDEENTNKLDPGERHDVYVFRDEAEIVSVAYDQECADWILVDGLWERPS